MSRVLIVVLSLGMLAGCADGDDPRVFVANAGKDLRGKVDPLPEVKPYEPFVYEAMDLPDPFRPRKLSPAAGSGKGSVQPAFDRPKQPLENFPLESLKMVGTLQQGKLTYGLVRAPDKTLHRVKPGNYMGQNFGIITEITETEIKLTEVVQDSAGDWTERSTALTLLEEGAQQTQKR